MRIIANAPIPGGVARAAIVSLLYMIFKSVKRLYFLGELSFAERNLIYYKLYNIDLIRMEID